MRVGNPERNHFYESITRGGKGSEWKFRRLSHMVCDHGQTRPGSARPNQTCHQLETTTCKTCVIFYDIERKRSELKDWSLFCFVLRKATALAEKAQVRALI